MNIVDGRGQHRKILSDKNRKTVEHFFRWSTEATITDCCKATGLSFKTVKRHIGAIQDDLCK